MKLDQITDVIKTNISKSILKLKKKLGLGSGPFEITNLVQLLTNLLW